MMRFIPAFLMLCLFVGLASADPVSIVKNTRNRLGIKCVEIPRFIEQKLGFRVITSKWSFIPSPERTCPESNRGGRVALRISAQKKANKDEVYVSYAWHPEYVWSVKNGTKIALADNTLARDWMRGKR